MMFTQSVDEPETRLSVARSERRRCPRYPCHGSVEAMVLFPEFLLRGEILDISLTGCFLKTKSHAPMDRYSRVDLRFVVNGNQYRTLARVMGIRSGNGVGVEFNFDSPRAETAFKGLVRSLSPTTGASN
jgi:hypothetical protein